MDLLHLIDTFGEAGAALAVGLGLGLAFGIFAQRSAFCTRTAVLDLSRGRGVAAFSVWLAGLAAALLAVQMMLATGTITLAETRFFANAQSLSGALIGGGLFGIGMAMTRGCVSRLIVLSAAGNLRALTSIIVVALVGLATLSGFLVPLRDPMASLWSSAAVGGNDLLAQFALPRMTGIVIGAGLGLAALALAVAGRASFWRIVGGIGVGLTVATGWYLSYSLSALLFDPIPVESLSYIRPLAVSLAALAAPASGVGLEEGLIAGTLAGALVSALVSGSFRFQSFGEAGAPPAWRYFAGAALMGFGGVLAGGCTVGAGLTGGSALAISALVALTAMALGAVLADRVLDPARGPEKKTAAEGPPPLPGSAAER